MQAEKSSVPQPDPAWSVQESLNQIDMNMNDHQTKLLRPKIKTAKKGLMFWNINPATVGSSENGFKYLVSPK